MTHIKRTSSCVIAEAGGASEASIRRGGRWNNEKTESCYLTALPREVVRSLAGFNSQGGEFFLPRAEVKITDRLKEQVFPQVVTMERLFSTGKVQDIAGQGFLRLLEYLETVLLQDSVVLRQMFPLHPIWNHPLFASSDYAEFSSVAIDLIKSTAGEQVHPTIRAALPVLTNVVESGLAHISMRLDSVESGVQHVAQDVAKLMGGGFRLVYEGTALPPISAPDRDLTGPSYRLSRGLRSVVDVWNEYENGLNGMPAVRTLEQQYGAKWRSSETERRFFSRRKVYYVAFEELARSEGIDTHAVAEKLESQRRQMHLSIDAFMKHIKAEGYHHVLLGSRDDVNTAVTHS